MNLADSGLETAKRVDAKNRMKNMVFLKSLILVSPYYKEMFS